MEALIGFGGKFYTLWNFEIEKNYIQDSYGKYHLVGETYRYFYIKNISFDVEKIKELFPTTKIDVDLKGNKSFVRSVKTPNPDGFFWFGKYFGKKIDEILETDFKYCMWVSENGSGNEVQYIKNSEIYVQHVAKIEKEQSERFSKAKLNAGDCVEVNFDSNAWHVACDIELGISEYYYCTGYVDNLVLKIILINGVKRVNSMYPYLMPNINGKEQRTKNKTIKVNIVKVDEELCEKFGKIYQTIYVQ